MNLTSVIIKQLNINFILHKQSQHKLIQYKCEQCDQKGSILMYKQKVANRLGKYLNVILYWWFFQFVYWKSSLFGTFATHAFSRLFKCEQCDREETQKHLLSTHKRVGTKFKCNQCDRIACQWCSLKSHKKRKYIKYQCDHCHYKPSKNQLKNNDRNIKGQINIRSHLPKPHHITHSQS